jgi:quercetin dioxygenase-like cupin family protein
LIILPRQSEDERGHVEGGRHNREPCLYANPGGAVTGEHAHPAIGEWFTVVRGRVGLRIDGRESIAELDQRMHVPPGVAHDWWNVGEEEAYVVIEISPGQSFER